MTGEAGQSSHGDASEVAAWSWQSYFALHIGRQLGGFLLFALPNPRIHVLWVMLGQHRSKAVLVLQSQAYLYEAHFADLRPFVASSYRL